jgi:predicted O-methyltransferase YrrM
MRKLLRRFMPLADMLLVPCVYPAAWLLKAVRRIGVQRLPRSKNALLKIGVFPIRNHYYEPQFDNRNPVREFSDDRILPGIDWNARGQIAMLNSFKYSEEIGHIPREKTDKLQFYFDNSAFGPGDAEIWYQIIRSIKPRRIIEIGSGYSTLMAAAAIRKNQSETAAYKCEHVCIEPYEMPWLEEVGVATVRKKVEELNPSYFSRLEENDILFIDSSHIIRPQGDVTFEYLELLPSLKKGVIVHVHDIFSPKNYPSRWLIDEVRFWNEQYLLEAFLTHNMKWKIVAALNYLHHNHYETLKSVAPFLTPGREPGSFYIQKVA